MSYAYPSSTVTDVTVMDGGTWRFTRDANQFVTAIRGPGSPANDITIARNSNGVVTKVTKDGVVTNYARAVSGTTATTTVTNALSQQTVVTSDLSKGRPVQVRDAEDNITAFEYDTKGRLVSVTYPEENKTVYSYDARGNLTQVTDVPKPGSGLNTRSRSATFPSSCTNNINCNKPTSTTDANGNVTNYTYDPAHGGLLTVTSPADANGVRPRTRYSYQQVTAVANQPVTVLSEVSQCRTQTTCAGTANERKISIGYDTTNIRPVSITRAAGNGSLSATSNFGYDAFGNRITVDGFASGTADTTRVRYDAGRRVVGIVSPDPDDAGAAKFPAKRYSYNARGQLYLAESGTVNGLSDADWAAFSPTDNTLVQFDTHGRPIRQKVRNGSTDHQVTDVRYDAAGRIQCSMVRMNPANWGTLPSSCSPTQTTGPNGPDRVTYNHYDALGRVWKVTTGYGTSIAANEQTLTFTENGQVATVKDAENNLTTYEYDGFDRLIKTRFPVPTKGANQSSTTDYELVGYYSGSTFVSGYDANDNVIHFTTRRGERLDMSYDNLNRLITKIVPERSGLATAHTRDVFYEYDLFGNLTKARFNSLTGPGSTFAYDGLGRMTQETTSLGQGARTVSYLYNSAGDRTRVTHPDGKYVEYLRRSSGDLYYARINGSPLFYPNYDSAGRLYRLRRRNTSSATWAEWTQFGYDALSRISSLTTNPAGTSYDATTTFSYNPASQIASNTQNNDRYAWTGHSPINRGYTANGRNQYSAVAGTGFTYDTNGNLTSDGTNTYVYDVENRLVSANVSGTTNLFYDPLGRLYRMNKGGAQTWFLYDGSDLIGEYDAAGSLLRRYVHGTGAGDDPLVWFEGSSIADSARRYLYADERGSIVAVTNSAGSVLSVNSYDEYGIPAVGNDGRFQYTGQAWLDEIGMYYYKARMYSPTLGRFMQIDPIGYGDGMNMYAYVQNDPVNGVDPTGLGSCFFASRIKGSCWHADGGGGGIAGSGGGGPAGARGGLGGNAGGGVTDGILVIGERLPGLSFDDLIAHHGVNTGSLTNLARAREPQRGELADRCLGRASALDGTPAYKATVELDAVKAKFAQHLSSFRDGPGSIEQSYWASSFGLGDLELSIGRSRFYGAAPTSRGAVRVTFDTGRRVGYDARNGFAPTTFITVIFTAPVGRDPETGLPIRTFQTAYPGC